MKSLRIGALVVALLGAGAWDAALPFTLPTVALVIFAIAVLLSNWTTRRRVARLTRRLAAAGSAERDAVFADPGFAEMAQTLTELAVEFAAPPPAVGHVSPTVAETAKSAEIILFDRHRKNARGGEREIFPTVPEAVEMQRRLVDRIDTLRTRRHVQAHAALPVSTSEIGP